MLCVCAYICVCMCLYVCECVCMREPPARLCTMDVCVYVMC